jgi:hypothetical protein
MVGDREIPAWQCTRTAPPPPLLLLQRAPSIQTKERSKLQISQTRPSGLAPPILPHTQLEPQRGESGVLMMTHRRRTLVQKTFIIIIIITFV